MDSNVNEISLTVELICDRDEGWHELFEAAGEDEDMLAELEQAEEGEQRFAFRTRYDGVYAPATPILVCEPPKVHKIGEAWPTIFVPVEPDMGWPMTAPSPLMDLPAELRNLIYECYLCSRDPLDEPDLVAQPPHGDNEECEFSVESFMSDLKSEERESSDLCIEDVTRWTTTIDFGTEDVEGLKHFVSSPLLQLNRQIRAEALPIGVLGKLWMTANVRAFPNLLNCLGPQLWPYITSIHIEDPFFPCGYEDPKPCLITYDQPLPRHHLARPPDSESENMQVYPPDDPVEAMTASHPIFQGSYSTTLISTIAALPHLRNLYMAFFMGGACKLPGVAPDVDRLVNVDMGPGVPKNCPSFQALADFIGKGMTSFVLEYLDCGLGPGQYVIQSPGRRFAEDLGRLACETGRTV